MNNVYKMFALASLICTVPVTAQAQTPVTEAPPLVNQYIADAYANRSPAWWNALGRQLVLVIDKPVAQVSASALQNIIFFATNHHDKINLDDAVPHLLEIYEQDDRDAHRIMALAALHAIGDKAAMRTLLEAVEDEPSERVRRHTVAALRDFYPLAFAEAR